jgi:hypothetical protein
MKLNKSNLVYQLSKIDRRQVQIAIVILTLAMFVLGAGAPGAWGDFKVIH